MLKRISSSDLRTQIRRVLNEVSYGRDEYVVEKFGEPAAVIINMEDYRLLESARSAQSAIRLEALLQDLRERSNGIGQDELVHLIEEARADYVTTAVASTTKDSVGSLTDGSTSD